MRPGPVPMPMPPPPPPAPLADPPAPPAPPASAAHLREDLRSRDIGDGSARVALGLATRFATGTEDEEDQPGDHGQRDRESLPRDGARSNELGRRSRRRGGAGKARRDERATERGARVARERDLLRGETRAGYTKSRRGACGRLRVAV